MILLTFTLSPAVKRTGTGNKFSLVSKPNTKESAAVKQFAFLFVYLLFYSYGVVTGGGR